VPAYKSVAQYEAEASLQPNGCLWHPAQEAYRRVYERRHGTPAPGLHVCHTCDYSHCILDAHHFLGTALDNQRDAIKKGRHINQVISEEQMKKRGAAISKALSGRSLSDQAKIKISKASKGRPASDKVREAARHRMLTNNPVTGKFGPAHPNFGKKFK
jgi:hypothetical protein